jgi:hypothetical protein
MRLRFGCLTFNIAGLAMALLAQPSYAIQLFNDGQSHSITSELQSDIAVTNNTQVTVETNGLSKPTASPANSPPRSSKKLTEGNTLRTLRAKTHNSKHTTSWLPRKNIRFPTNAG